MLFSRTVVNEHQASIMVVPPDILLSLLFGVPGILAAVVDYVQQLDAAEDDIGHVNYVITRVSDVLADVLGYCDGIIDKLPFEKRRKTEGTVNRAAIIIAKVSEVLKKQEARNGGRLGFRRKVMWVFKDKPAVGTLQQSLNDILCALSELKQDLAFLRSEATHENRHRESEVANENRHRELLSALEKLAHIQLGQLRSSSTSELENTSPPCYTSIFPRPAEEEERTPSDENCESEGVFNCRKQPDRSVAAAVRRWRSKKERLAQEGFYEERRQSGIDSAL